MDNMQLWLSSSTDSINLNDSAEGFYLNPDLEGLTGLPEIRSVNGLNAGYDGGWTATQLWAARLITIRGVIALNDKAAVETKRKALAKLLAQGKNEDLELKFVSEAGNTYTTKVRTTNCTMALQRVFWRQEYQIQLRANDPLIYDDGGSELIAILRVMAGEGGFEIPFDIPFDIGGSITPTSIDVGDEATYPLIRLKGDLHSPTIINMTTNQQMQVLADIITTTEWHDYTTAYTTNGYMQINSTEDGAPLSLTHLYGNAEQETLSGKNLCSLAIYESANTAKFTIDKANLQKTFTLSYTSDVSANNGGIYLFTDGTNRGFLDVWIAQVANTRQSVSITLSDELFGYVQSATNVWITSYVVNGGHDTAKKPYDAQIENGSSMTDYEPYVGSIPSPNPDFPQVVNTVSGAQTVKITGKNLFDKNAITSGYLVSRGIGTLSQNSSYGATDFIPVRAGQQLHFGDDFNRWYSAFYDANKVAVGEPTNTANITIPDGVAYLRTSLLLTNLDTAQLELGNSASSFEPYQSQSQEINLGKNLANPQTFIDWTSTMDTLCEQYNWGSVSVRPAYGEYDGRSHVVSWRADTLYSVKDQMTNPTYEQSRIIYKGIFKPNTQYTVSADVYSNAYANWQVLYTDGTVDALGYHSSAGWENTSVITGAGKTVQAIRMNYASGYTYVDLDTFQIEEGITQTSYAPYKTPLELAKIGTYQDYIWNDDGTWKIHKAISKVVYDGSADETWNLPQIASLRYPFGTFADGKATTATSIIGVMCDTFTLSSSSETGIAEQYQFTFRGTNYNDGLWFFCPKSAIAGSTSPEILASWKTYLSAHPTTVYYALATPTDTEITDSELIAQLNHIYELYQGVNNLWLIPSAGAQGEVEVSYATEVDRDYHEVVIDCQARTVTQDGHNLYPALAEGSEFIRLVPGENKLYLTSEVESDNGTAEVKFKKGNISI